MLLLHWNTFQHSEILPEEKEVVVVASLSKNKNSSFRFPIHSSTRCFSLSLSLSLSLCHSYQSILTRSSEAKTKNKHQMRFPRCERRRDEGHPFLSLPRYTLSSCIDISIPSSDDFVVTFELPNSVTVEVAYQ